MLRLTASALVLLVATLPAGAAARRHHARAPHRGTHEAGLPITAEPGSIRINAVGEVISQPVPVIEKEKNFNARADQQLTRPLKRPSTDNGPSDHALEQPLGTSSPGVPAPQQP